MKPAAAFTIARARQIAMKAHAEQQDQAGRPYVGHLERTACGAAALAPDHLREHAVMAAWLHDIIEDNLDVNPDHLRRQGVPASVLAAVVLVTKTPGIDTVDYLTRIAANPLALVVKTADMNDNSDEARLSLLPEALATRLRAKYQNYREILASLA